MISPRDTPLVAFMSSMTGALGMDGVFRMRASCPAGGGSGDDGDDGGVETMQGVLPRDAANEFFENFLVPRFVASAGCEEGAAAVDALKAMIERFLLAEDGETRAGDWCCIVQRASVL